MFVLSGLHRPWQPSRHLPPQLCLDLNTGNDAWTPNPGWSDIVESKHHWKKFPCSNDLGENTLSHSDYKSHFYMAAWFVSENVSMWTVPFGGTLQSLKFPVLNMLFLEGPISPSCNLSRGPDWWQRRWAMFFPGCAQQFGAFSASLLLRFLASAIMVALLLEGPL